MHNHSYENEFNLHVNEISFSYEKMGTKTRFEEEARGNSEVAYYPQMEIHPIQVGGGGGGGNKNTTNRKQREAMI